MKQSELWKTEDRTSYSNRHQLLSILPRKTYKNPPRKVIKKNIILELRNLNKKIQPKLLEKISHESSFKFLILTIDPLLHIVIS